MDFPIDQQHYMNGSLPLSNSSHIASSLGGHGSHLSSLPAIDSVRWTATSEEFQLDNANLTQHLPQQYHQQQQKYPSYPDPRLPSVQDHPSHTRCRDTNASSHLHESTMVIDQIRDNKSAKRFASDTVSSLGNRNGEEASSSELFPKRPRLEQTASTSVPFKVQKEKLSERITALQQLVSPFGKTDTASVLLEAIGYIKFLQDQVQVLSMPFMKPRHVIASSLNRGRSLDCQDLQIGKLSLWSTVGAKVKNVDHHPRQDLWSRGLCLVPVSCTLQVANDNGAHFWTPATGVGGSSCG